MAVLSQVFLKALLKWIGLLKGFEMNSCIFSGLFKGYEMTKCQKQERCSYEGKSVHIAAKGGLAYTTEQQ